MGQNSAIEWTDKVWNPVTGCTKVSAGCKNCYAERIAERFWKGRKFTDVQLHHDRLDEPLRWKKPAKIFVNSMSDLFHESVPFEFIDRVFASIAFCPRHTFQILTKRPARMLEYMAFDGGFGRSGHIDHEARKYLRDHEKKQIPTGRMLTPFPWSHVWLGTSIENQQAADERIPLLLQCPAAIRFLSVEPMIEPVDLLRIPYSSEGEVLFSTLQREPVIDSLRGYCLNGTQTKVNWVICGGESGPNARPMHPQWARSLRDQCQAAGVPFFFKQMTKKGPIPEDLMIREFPQNAHACS